MNKAIIIFILALAFIGGFLIFYNPNTPQTWESKIDEQENVTVTVTPADLGTESREWKFDIVMSTHSVELDQDMATIAVLVDDFGKEYRPVRWEGVPAGGHHREGVLTFNQIIPAPKSIKMKISSVGDVIRNFTWQL